MSYHSRVYRQRNAHTHDESKEHFFAAHQIVNKSGKKSGFFQSKLAINKPGDSYETEADSVASSVVNGRSALPVVQQKRISSIQRLSTPVEDEKLGTNDSRMAKDKEIQEKPIQRMATEKEEMKGVQKKEEKKEIQKKEEKKEIQKKEEKKEVQKKDEEKEVQKKDEEKEVQKKDEEKEVQKKDEEKEVQKKEEEKEVQKMGNGNSSHSGNASHSTSKQIESTSGKGNALPGKTLNEMNASFGVDFSNVRVHNDTQSAEMSERLHAQAFTHGNDIYFNKGKFNPASSEGKFLLAHELTHTIQQKDDNESIGIQRKADERDFPFDGRVDEPLPGEFLLWNFSIGSHFLKQEHLKEFPRIVKGINDLFKVNKDAEVDIEGLASSSGTDVMNDPLAGRRANMVQNALISSGVSKSKIKITSSGSAKAFPETTAESMAKGRAVRIIPVLHSKLTGISEKPPVLTSNDCTAEMKDNMDMEGKEVLLERTDSLVKLQAGNAKTMPGMNISASVNVDTKKCGTVEFVQNVQPFREIVYKDASRNRLSSASMLLDDGDPYKGQETLIDTGSSIVQFSNDSPSLGIDLLSEGVIKTIEARDEFKMYLMFKPKTGARQTLQAGLWTWVGQARNKVNEFFKGQFEKDSSISRIIPQKGKGKTTTELPVSSPVAQDLKWQTDNGGQSGRTFAQIHAERILNKSNSEEKK